jgi:predicted amino acid racemase
MSWPRLVIDQDLLAQNVRRVVNICKDQGISVAGVTKGLCAHPGIAEILLAEGCSYLADSRITNLISLRYAFPDAQLMLLRIPILSEIPFMVKYTDCALVSMPRTIQAIESFCSSVNRRYQIIVMCDLGDLREGILLEDMDHIIRILCDCHHVECIGIGVNFGCFGGVLPSVSKLQKLVDAGRALEMQTGHPLQIFSGGSTSSLALLERGEIPEGVNNLRIGEAFFLGTDVTGKRNIPYLHRDLMHLEAEIVEIWRKPSCPFGTIGADAFGNIPSFEDRGSRLRAIVAVGQQDLRISGVRPMYSGLEILGGSSDHMILDIEDNKDNLEIGQILKFGLDYGAMLSLATSPYVQIHMTGQA